MLFAWIILGVVLIAIELHHLAFFALFGAAGAFAAALVAAVAPSAIPLQVAVAVIVTIIGVLAVRPRVNEVVQRRHEGHVARGVHGTLVGEEVLTLDTVGDLRHVGHVRLAGERWLAASGSGSPIPVGTKVLVTVVEGTTLVVWPVDGRTHFPEELPSTSEQAPQRAEGDEA